MTTSLVNASSTARDPSLSPMTAAVASSPAEDVSASFIVAQPEDETTRISALRELLGRPNEDVRPFVDAIREVVFAGYARHVVPLIHAHWPQALDARSPDAAAGTKLKFLACNLYASAPYTVLFCSERRPWMIGCAVSLGGFLGLTPSALSSTGAVAMKLLGRFCAQGEQRRIVLIAAFIATIDHAFDHCLEGVPPHERERRMKGLLDGTWLPDEGAAHAGPFRLTRALQTAMAEGIEGEDKRVFEAALARVVEWVESEVKSMTGIVDPAGLCWRTAGVEGTIDGLVFPVHRYAGPGARAWMYGVSLFVQIMDDWIDAEKDRRDIRPTPVLTGRWTLTSIVTSWDETVAGIEKLARESGLVHDGYRVFVRDSYQLMIHEVMEAMCRGTAA